MDNKRNREDLSSTTETMMSDANVLFDSTTKKRAHFYLRTPLLEAM